jgi:acyl carrier protein
MQSAEQEIRQFIVDNFLYGEIEKVPADNDSLLDLGIVDSTGILEMVAFLEGRFGIQIYENELVPANLDSLRKIADFVARKTAVHATR